MAFWAPYQHDLSKHYLEHVAPVRRPIAVMCPYRADGRHGALFVIDSHPTGQPDAAWTVDVDMASLVVGQRPVITVSPSIHLVGIYHGFLQGGVLTDDIGS